MINLAIRVKLNNELNFMGLSQGNMLQLRSGQLIRVGICRSMKQIVSCTPMLRAHDTQGGTPTVSDLLTHSTIPVIAVNSA